MKIENINCWEEFEPKLEEIKSQYLDSQILYRGQSKDYWDLETTLERFGKVGISFENYLDFTLRCVNQIESKIKMKFNLPTKDIIIREINTHNNSFELHLQPYKYWIYLRHHRFPSPFLDWTSCPQIAAFFAFASQNKTERCSIYIYIERPLGIKVHSDPGPRIWLMGPDIEAHKRHFLQKSWYTMALKAKKVRPDMTEYHKHEIISHEEIFESSDDTQDLIIKITIPRKERIKVLQYLDKNDINQHSLFDSENSFNFEESLMQTLAFKEIQ